MENIELWVIGCLLITCAYYMLQNKKNKYWRYYFKEQYFREKDLVDKYIEKACDGKPDELKNGKLPISHVSFSEAEVCDHKFDADGAPCRKCGKTVSELLG